MALCVTCKEADSGWLIRIREMSFYNYIYILCNSNKIISCNFNDFIYKVMDASVEEILFCG